MLSITFNECVVKIPSILHYWKWFTRQSVWPKILGGTTVSVWKMCLVQCYILLAIIFAWKTIIYACNFNRVFQRWFLTNSICYLVKITKFKFWVDMATILVKIMLFIWTTSWFVPLVPCQLPPKIFNFCCRLISWWHLFIIKPSWPPLWTVN